jgi:hypothetical protein
VAKIGITKNLLAKEVIMPRGDRTGPDGMGSMTGRNLGYCNGYDSPGFTKGVPRGGAGFGMGRNFGRGRGYGRGMGVGRGLGFNRGYNYPAYPAPIYSAKDEAGFLENEVKSLTEQLKVLEARLSELKSEE